MKDREADDKIPERPEIKAILYGVGSIGASIGGLLLKKKGVRIVGAVDSAPHKVGRDLGGLIRAGEPLGVAVSSTASDLFSRVKADIALHATSSFLKEVYPQLAELIRHNVNVISTCEELAYPCFSNADLANELDELAKQHNVTVLGAGINPGFLMDTLAITLTGVCQEVKHIKVERVIDAARRRAPFQKKIGAGLTTEEFREKMEKGVITGHVGLRESIAMTADAVGWNLQKIDIGNVEPIIAERRVESEALKVESGRVAGLKQDAYGVIDGTPVITLAFKAYIGAEVEYDSVRIDGIPSISQKITPCVHGDLGTAAIIVNSIPKVINAKPGLKTMKDLPLLSAVLGDIRRHLTARG